MTVAELPVDDWAKAKPAVRSRARWRLLARPAQLTPDGDWNVWLFMAGRGAGKTRAAAEDMAYYGLTHPNTRLAIVAPTYADARDTCVEGESGLKACLPHEEILTWNRSLGELVLRNGTRYKLFSSDEPERLRGPQHHRAWCDELAAFRDEETWDMLQMGLRLGEKPQAVATTTPKSRALLRKLLLRSDVIVTRGSTWDNAANLAPAALESLRARYHGTRLGRQELEGELLEDVEGALWKRSWFDRPGFRVPARPVSASGSFLEWQRRPITGVDPSDGTEEGAEHAYATSALAMDHDLYVIASEGLRCSPYEFAVTVIQHSAKVGSEIVVEKNHGGQWLVTTFKRAMSDLGLERPLRAISAAQGKRTRAEPISALYEPRVFGTEELPGRVHHIGAFEELEDQMTGWTGAPNEPSPDRLDALVWSLWDFRSLSFKPPPREEDNGAVPYRDGPEPRLLGTPHKGPFTGVQEGAVAWR